MQVVRQSIPPLVVFLLRVLALTLRWRVVDLCGMTRPELKRPLIGAFWHNRLLAVPLLYRRFCPARRGHCLTSPSDDGEIIAEVMDRFGIGSVRGSSSRRGAVAMREMREVLEQGGDMAITPDGPRGPKYELHPGVVKLAQITGAPLVAIHVEYSRYWKLKSWDAFRIPKPFARVSVTFGPLHEVPLRMERAAFETERARLEAELNGSFDSQAELHPVG